jgi:hypothetical protein
MKMTKLKLGCLVDDKPVKLSVELPANVHRDLVAYSEVLAHETYSVTIFIGGSRLHQIRTLVLTNETRQTECATSVHRHQGKEPT